MVSLEAIRQFYPQGEPASEEYVILSGRQGARWVLPRDGRRLNTVLADWRPYSRTMQLSWFVVRLAARAGLLSWLPGARCFSSARAAAHWQMLGWEQDCAPFVVAYVGTEGPHRKLVMTLADPRSGGGRIVVKQPLVPTAWPMIAREYEALRALPAHVAPLAPRPLLIDHRRQFSVQSYLQARPVGAALTPAHYDFLDALVEPQRRIKASQLCARLRARQLALVERGHLNTITSARIDALLEQIAWQGEVPEVRIHGDFAPWNLKRRADGRLCAVDWEHAAAAGLPFFDLFHYARQVHDLLGRAVAVAPEQHAERLIGAGYPASLARSSALREAVSLLVDPAVPWSASCST